MATEKWIAGTVGLTWTTAYTSAATFDSLASGNAILGDLQLDNSGNLDIFCDFSLILGSAAFVSPNFVGLYMYPLTQDGSTYGDGRFGTAAAGPPPSPYLIGNFPLVAATQAQTATISRAIMPPGKWKPVLYNQGGVAWAGAGANKLYYRTYNRSVA